MKCPFCKDEVRELEGSFKKHLIACKLAGGHIHVHGDLEDKTAIKEMMAAMNETIGVSNATVKLDRKEVVFHNRQRIGDILMFTCGVRDFKAAYPDVRCNVISTAGHIWDHNPAIDRTLVPTQENTVKIGPSKGTNQSNRIDWHFANAYRISIEDALGITIPQGESRPDIWLTREEYEAPRLFKDPYWIIVVSGEKGWGCKMYPFDRWQEFTDKNQDITFLQIGAQGDNPPRLQGNNIIDYVGKTENRDTGIRDLFKLFLNAEGSIGLVSFHMHLSGALYKPAIVVAGAREPVHFTRYEGHRYLSTDGCLPCAVKACWHCELNACINIVASQGKKIPACVDIITPKYLSSALNFYYKGGRLKKQIPSIKPALKNIVNKIDPKTIVQAKKPEDNATKYGLNFGGGCITRNDWEFIQNTVKKYSIKTVLEFGSGLSTLLMNDAGLKVETYETNHGWIDRLKKIQPQSDINWWDGVGDPFPIATMAQGELLIHNEKKFDMAFVDGPAGGESREHSTKIASERADIVIIHDANRPNERAWQDKYIKDSYKGHTKGGNRCHLWVKEGVIQAQRGQGAENKPQKGEDSPPINKTLKIGAKHIKLVSTARGWGGCARSITTIMKMLLSQGHEVEFIPFRNSVGSREFRECIEKELKGLTVTLDYSTVKDPCDVLFVYADDYVWEFSKPEVAEIFLGAKAEKKIMMLNYRRGPVGQAEWTKGWDKYMFLNSGQEKQLLKILPGIKTKVLPPCTDLSSFFETMPDYNTNLRIVRHSSQGDTKFIKDGGREINEVLDIRPDIKISMMPGPSFMPSNGRFQRYPRNAMPIYNFLETGNLFWYSLPYGYMDMGPRVIIEAMAAGLPILADNWGGAKDRVTPECGWLTDAKEDQIEIIRNVTTKELEEKGRASRERALKEFDAKAWIKEIIAI